MWDPAITTHAEKRMRERALPPLILDLLLECGDFSHDHHGAEICYFGKRARRRISRRVGKQIASRLTDYWHVYAVVADGRVVTAGYRNKRIPRN